MTIQAGKGHFPDRAGTEDAGRWKRLSQLALLVTVLSFYAYRDVINFSFVADDNIYLGVHNNFLLELPLADLWRLFVTPTNPWEYLPVRDFTYWLDARLFGLSSDGFHATNLVWYAISCWAVFFALRETLLFEQRIDQERAVAFAALGAMLFAVHPAHVEPVAWISGRKDLLAGVFVFLSWGWTLKSCRVGWTARDAALVTSFATLAFFSKGAAIASGGIIILVLGVWLIWRRSSPGNDRWLPVTVLIVLSLLLAAAWAIHSSVAQEKGIALVNDPGLSAKLERASRIVAAHFKILFFPLDMRAFHDVYSMGAWHWLISSVALASLLFAGYQLMRRRSVVLACAILWVIVPLLPYLQLQPFTTWSMASDRFVYQASFGATLLFVFALSRLALVKAMIFALAPTLFILFPVTYQRVPDWEVDRVLLQKEADKNPTFFSPARYAALILILKHDYDGAARVIDRIARSDAREILHVWLHYRKSLWLADREGVGSDERYRRFCIGLGALDAELNRHYLKIPMERDIPFNNLLNNTVRLEYPGRKIPGACLPFLQKRLVV